MSKQTTGFQEIAQSLACPQGVTGIEVAKEMNRTNRFISRKTYELLDLSNQDRVLEIGLGNGAFVKEIIDAAQDIHFTGIDISETMIEEGKKINAHYIHSHQAELLLANVEKLPFKDQSFNKVCTVNTIYFWENPTNALQEIYRVLVKPGIFVIAFRPYVPGQSLDFSAYGFREYTIEEVKDLLSAHPWQITQQKTEVEPPIWFQQKQYYLKSQYFVIKK
ncbi:hypothetical protein BKI52_18140 [marine bacterium AO1-C]|nr:hypothetical protein BKI52_18140 [marine bacterium AO1-C]